ncbi:MAG: hypothetical protein RLZZ299_1020 [Pseudomonadota bacterium]
MIALVLVGSALAVNVASREVPCPLGTGTARVYTRVSANGAGGHDSDLAGYSSDGQWRTYRVSTCTPSLLSLYGADMDAPIPAERAAAVTAALQKAVAALPDPGSPTPWERYGLAAAVYEALGRDAAFLGDVWVEASWTARDAAVGYYAGLQGPAGARALLEAGAAELSKPIAPDARKRVLYNLARVAHRGGWTAERDAWLARFEAAGALTAREQQGLARFRHLARDVETALQDRAIAAYTTALRGTLPYDEKVRVTYVLADLLRRRDRPRDALPLYTLVANDSRAPENLRSMALFLAGPLADALDPKDRPKPAAPSTVPSAR